jgi:hypothetical protein
MGNQIMMTVSDLEINFNVDESFVFSRQIKKTGNKISITKSLN